MWLEGTGALAIFVSEFIGTKGDYGRTVDINEGMLNIARLINQSSRT